MILLAGACSVTPVRPQGIEERAQLRWDMVLKGNLEEAYQYLSPGFRSSISLEQYQKSLKSQRVQWTGAEYSKSECLESSCKVTILLRFSLIGVLPGVPRFNSQTDIEENWVKVDDKWWHVPEN